MRYAGSGIVLNKMMTERQARGNPPLRGNRAGESAAKSWPFALLSEGGSHYITSFLLGGRRIARMAPVTIKLRRHDTRRLTTSKTSWRSYGESPSRQRASESRSKEAQDESANSTPQEISRSCQRPSFYAAGTLCVFSSPHATLPIVGFMKSLEAGSTKVGPASAFRIRAIFWRSRPRWRPRFESFVFPPYSRVSSWRWRKVQPM